MADNEVIGKVTSASGDVTVRGADGQPQALQVGDEIHANDMVSTGDGSSVIFEFTDGSRKGMPANTEITLNDSIYDPAAAQEVAAEGISTGDATEEAPAGEATEAGGPEPIGTLSSGSGDVRAQAPDGSERALEAGDPVYSGDTILTGDGSLAIFDLSDGSRKGLASNAEIYLDETVLTPQETEVAEADMPTAEQVEAAMAADPSAAGAEPAAPAEPIGVIKASSGEITAVGADGSERTLADGDELFAGETLLSADASTAIIEYTDGSTSGLSSNSEVVLQAPAPQPAEQEGETALAGAEAPTAEQVEAAMVAEPTAAGAEPGVPAEPVGTIQATGGGVKAVGADGSERTLAEGDEVFAGETLVSADASTAIIEYTDGSTAGLSSNSQMTLQEPAPQPAGQEGETALADAGAAGEDAAAEQQALGTGIPVGTVSAADGEVVAVAADGTERKLEAGDEVNADETLLAGDNSTAILNFYDGSSRGLASNSEMTLDGSTLNLAAIRAGTPEGAGAVAEAGDAGDQEEIQVAAAQSAQQPAEGAVAAVEELDPEVEEIQEAIEEGADPSEEAEATAAGEQGADGGHSAVFLARSSQKGSVDSGYDTDEIFFAAVAESEEDALQARLGDAPDFVGSTPPLPFHTLIGNVKTVVTLALNYAETIASNVADTLRVTSRSLDSFLNEYDVSNLGNSLFDQAQELVVNTTTATQTLVNGLLEEVGPISGDPNALDPDHEGAADGATVLFSTVFILDTALDQFAQATTLDVRDAPFFTDIYDGLIDTVNTVYGELGGTLQEAVDAVVSTLNETIVQEGGDQVQQVVFDDVINDQLEANDPGLADALRTNAGPYTGEVGDRQNTVVEAVADEVYADEDSVDGEGSGVVGDLRGTEDSPETDGGNAGGGTIVGETFDVVDEGGDIADTAAVGKKYEDGEYVDSGNGLVADGGESVREQDPGMDKYTPYQESFQQDGEDLAADMQDVGEAAGGYVGTNAGNLQNIAMAVQEALTPPGGDEGGSGGGGGDAGGGDFATQDALENFVMGPTEQSLANVLNALASDMETNDPSGQGGGPLPGALRDAGEQIASGGGGELPGAPDGGGTGGGDGQATPGAITTFLGSPAPATFAAILTAIAADMAAGDPSGMEGGPFPDLLNTLATGIEEGGSGDGGTPLDAVDLNPDAVGDVGVDAPQPGGDSPLTVSGPVIDTPEDGSGGAGDLEVTATDGENGSLNVYSGELHGDNSPDAGGTPPSVSGEFMGEGGSSDMVTPTSTQSSGTGNWDVPGVSQGATSNLMADGAAQSMNLHTIHVAEDHDSAVFHLTADELDSGENGFDIDNFHTETDTLEIADLLGEAGQQLTGGGAVNGESLSQFLHVEDDGEGGSMISISDGQGGTTSVHLQGVDLTHDENGDLLNDAQILDGMLAAGALDISSAGPQVTDALDPNMFG